MQADWGFILINGLWETCAGQSFGIESTYLVFAKKAVQQMMKACFAVSIYLQLLEATIMSTCISVCSYNNFLSKIGLIHAYICGLLVMVFFT